MRNAKKWVLVYLLVLAVGIASYMAVCFKANTLGYFTNIKGIPYFYNDDYARKIKSTYLYEHRGEYEGVLVGGSKSGAVDPSLMTELTGLNYYNMYMNVGNFPDYLRYITFLVENCEVKEITLVLSSLETKFKDQSSRGNAFVPPAILTGNPFKRITECLSYRMTDIKTTLEELADPPSNRINISDFLSDGMRNRYNAVRSHNKDPEEFVRSMVLNNQKSQLKQLFRKAASKQTARPLCLKCLQQIYTLCNEHGVTLRVIVGPSFLLDKARYECEEYYDYLEDIVKICGEVWDFSDYNRFNMNPFNYYDRSHYSKELANIMLYRVFDTPQAKGYEDFGMILTKDNVHEAMNQRRASFEKYKEEFETTGEITYYGLSDDSYIPWAPQWTTPGIEAYQQN